MVYLVPGADSSLAKQSVLLSPRLAARLEAMARPVAAPTEGVVLVSAVYDGKRVKGAAEFDAVFQVHSLGEGPDTLTLPLEGVQLAGDVLLDGARVYPVALAAPLSGYTLRVRGAGRHKVELRFRVLVPASVEDGKPLRETAPGIRHVRFSVPRLVQSRLVFRVGAGASHLQALVKHGAQRVASEKGGQRLEVDLGAIAAPVHLRWYQEGKPARPTRIEFREAYLWDLRPDASHLTALLRYAISGGAVTTLHLDLPDSLEVRSAQARRPAPVRDPSGARRPDEGTAPPDAVRLSDWSISGASSSRVVQLEFPGPVSGAVEVTLEMVPRVPWAGPLLLPIPRPHGEAAKALSYLAYRAQGLQAARTDFLRLRGIRNDEFAPFWPASSRPASSSLTYAGAFHHDPRLFPRLQLQLRPLAAAPGSNAGRHGARRAAPGRNNGEH